MAIDAHRPWRAAKVTERRAAVDFAEWMRHLVDGPYVGRERIQVVPDNLSTHTSAAFHVAFAPADPRAPQAHSKHAGWVNMVEIEIGVLGDQCLARRIPDLLGLTRKWPPASPPGQANARLKWMWA